MKTFLQISKELFEAKFKLPAGHDLIKTSVQKIDGEKIDMTFTSSKNGKQFHVFMDKQKLGDYKTLKQAEKEVKDMNSVLGEMVSSGLNIKESINEINNRV